MSSKACLFPEQARIHFSRVPKFETGYEFIPVRRAAVWTPHETPTRFQQRKQNRTCPGFIVHVRCVVNDEIKRLIKFFLKNVSKRGFVCLVGLPVCLDPFTYTARVDVTVKITRLYLAWMSRATCFGGLNSSNQKTVLPPSEIPSSITCLGGKSPRREKKLA